MKRTLRPGRESAGIARMQALVYGLAAALYLARIATPVGLAAGAACAAIAVLLARFMWRRHLKVGVGVAIAAVGGVAATLFGDWFLDTSLFSSLSARTTIVAADALYFGLLCGSVTFGLRLLAAWRQIFSVLEVALVVGSAAYTFLDHRNLNIHRPRFLADWALSQGIDPALILQGLGVITALMAIVLLVRAQRLSKLLISLFALLIVGGAVYWFSKDVLIEMEVVTGLGLTDQEQKDKDKGKSEGDKGEDGKGGGSEKDKGDGKGGSDGKGGGGGSGKNPFGGSSQQPPPHPVAVAVFHDDLESKNGILYFRQQVLSHYDGNHLVVDDSGDYDKDVLTEFPQTQTLAAAPVQREAFFTRVPTSMYLLVDHPQPLALSSSVQLTPTENPNPSRFVAAYGVISLVLSTDYRRLVGRGSVDPEWSPERVEHYLKTPDDPRYAALAEEILRDIDPRFAGDDLMKALMIKRYLEVEGFYTRTVKYKSDEDPAAAFLFGDKRGYCVHFAHSAAHLFRSQGIAARVAIGYAVDTNARGEGSSVLILADRAHAWPEIHIAGVGWLPFDIYPQRSDEKPPQLVERSLESMLGEMARGDKTGGIGDGDSDWAMPWATIGWSILAIFGLVLLVGYVVRGLRLLRPALGGGHAAAFVALLDGFSAVGLQRATDETRERHAQRLAALVPSLPPLTQLHLRLALGGPAPAELHAELRRLCAASRAEFRGALPIWRRAVGILNPYGWVRTR